MIIVEDNSEDCASSPENTNNPLVNNISSVSEMTTELNKKDL